ncbi:MAG: outer membrane protein assembly factor BamD [Methylococcales bacterium]|jgi:outer membrane protein assembly factor BamD|nr:outer membrane protein assembly factor BamD [Methylococcales bacterium]
MQRSILALLLMLPLLFGCSLLPDQDDDETKDWSASKFFSEAKAAVAGGDFETGIKYFETLQARYPFGRYAQQAQLEVAYAYYKFEEPDSSIAACDRFIKENPRHPNVDYAYYLKGLVNFNRGIGFIEQYVPTDSSQRDPGSARDSFKDFSTLLARYPNSKYAKDTRQRMVYLRNTLAQHEVNVADYYLKRHAYIAASNRAKQVIENFEKTPAAADGIAVLMESYALMGLEDLSSDAKRVLTLNYPSHPALSEVGGRDYLNRSAFETLFGLDEN